MAPLVNEYPAPVPMFAMTVLVAFGVANSFTLELVPESVFNEDEEEATVDEAAPVEPLPADST